MNVNETIEMKSPVSLGPKVSNGIASGYLKWQNIVNCHIFWLYFYLIVLFMPYFGCCYCRRHFKTETSTMHCVIVCIMQIITTTPTIG